MDFVRWQSTNLYNGIIHEQKWLAWPGCLLFFLMLFSPTSYQPVKAVLLAFVLIMIGARALISGKFLLHPSIVFWTLLMVATGFAFMLLGLVNNAPGATRVGTVYLLWPVVFAALLTEVRFKYVLDGIFKLLVFSSIVISLYSIYYLSYEIGWIPAELYFRFDFGQAVGFYKGHVEFNLYNIASFNFLLPFLFAMLLVKTKELDFSISRIWIWFACGLAIFVAILTGRRAVWVVMLISPLVVIAIQMFKARTFRIERSFIRLFIGFMIFVSLIFALDIHLFNLDILTLLGQLVGGFDFSGGGSLIKEGGSLISGGGASESVRAEQFFALLDGWQQNPLFGAGHGASAVGSLRDAEMPWAYELSYVALLFQTGLVGFSIYCSGVIWIFWMGFKIIRSSHWLGFYMLPVLVGTFCFLIANATNPYLAKFDYMWVIFLPVALINSYLLDKDKASLLERKL